MARATTCCWQARAPAGPRAAAANGDCITDFSPGDKIDVSGFFVDQGTLGDFLIQGPAIAQNGQIIFRVEQQSDGAHTLIEGNANDQTFQIDLNGQHTLKAGDFIVAA